MLKGGWQHWDRKLGRELRADNRLLTSRTVAAEPNPVRRAQVLHEALQLNALLAANEDADC
jgi:hypothetical protein